MLVLDIRIANIPLARDDPVEDCGSGRDLMDLEIGCERIACSVFRTPSPVMLRQIGYISADKGEYLLTDTPAQRSLVQRPPIHL